MDPTVPGAAKPGATPAPSDLLPDLLLVGAATRDLLPEGGWRLGGTVVFAALTAARLGLRAAIVTSGPPAIAHALAREAPGVAVALVPAAEATTFENLYDPSGARRQYLRGQAAPLTLADIPATWRAASLVLLAPLAQEVDPALAAALAATPPAATTPPLIAATPQGWLRRWDEHGLVRPGTWDTAALVLPALTALILSQDDLIASPSPESNSQLSAQAPSPRDRHMRAWSALVPYIVLTRGAEGADLYARDAGAPERFPAYPVRQVDPTGAGDVFAAAFLCALRTSGDPRQAVEYANCAASFAVERAGTAGIPSREQAAARLRV